MKRKVTLRDVADAANVSVMTVSNVINGKFDGMTPATQRRIEGIIRQLGYRPDLSARGLRQGRRFSLGMLIIDRSPRFLADPWTTNLVAGVSNHLRECDYGLLIQGGDGSSVAQMSMIRHSSTEGLLALISGPADRRQEAIHLLSETRQPLILFQEPLDKPIEDVCVFRQDDRIGAYELCRRLLARRPRRIVLLVSDWEWPAMIQRELGIREAVAEAGGGIELERVACREEDFGAIISTFGRHIEQYGVPDAVMGGNDQMALAAMNHLRAIGIAVPDAVMVTGFNNFDFAQFAEPRLTTAQSPAYALGARGAAALLNRLETGAFESAEVVLPVEIHEGGTTRRAKESARLSPAPAGGR